MWRGAAWDEDLEGSWLLTGPRAEQIGEEIGGWADIIQRPVGVSSSRHQLSWYKRKLSLLLGVRVGRGCWRFEMRRIGEWESR